MGRVGIRLVIADHRPGAATGNTSTAGRGIVLVALVGAAAVLVLAQVALYRQVQRFGFGSGRSGTAELYPLPLIVIFAASAAVAAIGLDRIALRSTREGVAQR